MMTPARRLALVSFLLGIIGFSLTIVVFASCSFYEAKWIDETGASFEATPGIYTCKYADGSAPFTGPLNFIDTFAVISLVVGFVSGTLATLAIGTRAFNLKFKIQNPGVSSCLFMLAAIGQVPTYAVLIGAACDFRYAGECSITTNGWTNAGAIVIWIVASCFSRSVVGTASQSSGTKTREAKTPVSRPKSKEDSQATQKSSKTKAKKDRQDGQATQKSSKTETKVAGKKKKKKKSGPSAENTR